MSEVSANTPSPGTGNTSTPSTATSSPKPSSPKPSNTMTASDFRRQARSTPSTEESINESVERAQHQDPVESRNVGMEVEGTDEVTEQEPEETQDQDPEVTEEDFSWLEPLKAHKQLHGVDLAEVVTALAEGRLPDAFHDIIKLKMKRGDQEWESPLSRARAEAMMHHDYTAKLQELSKERNEYNSDKSEFIDMLQTWKSNPEALLSGLERLEFPVLEAAKLLAKRHQELAAMSPRERELYEKNQALERQMAKEKYEGRRQEKAKFDEQTKLEADKRSDFVSAAAAALFNKHSVPMDERTFNVFLSKFKIISESYPPGAPWTQEMVEQAFGATKYDYDNALVKRDQAQAEALKKPAAQTLVQKQEFTSPAREQVAKLKQQTTGPKPGKKGGPMTSSQFRKLALGR